MKYVSIPAKKCLAQRKNFSPPVTLGVFRYTLKLEREKSAPLAFQHRIHHREKRTLLRGRQAQPFFQHAALPGRQGKQCLAVGTSLVTEGVYDNRFRYTAELGRMGANIQVEGKTAIIDGVQTLRGCEVRACDLRAGAAMVIAAMCAEGMTLIEDAHFIERGYEDIVGKLTALGAHIRRIETYETPSVSEDAG